MRSRWWAQPTALRSRNHANANGRRNLDAIVRWFQSAGVLIDAQDNDRIAALVFGEQVRASRVDEEVARRLALRRFVLDISQPARILIDAEGDDRVVAAVRSVEKLAGGMDTDFGGAQSLLSAIGIWDCRDGLQRLQLASRGVVLERSHRQRHFVDHVRILAARMKGEVPWARAWFDISSGGIVRRQLPFLGIEGIDQDFVETQVRGEGELVVGREIDRVAVRSLLTLLVDTGAFVLNERRRIFERSIGVDWQTGDTASAVVGDQHILARRVDDEVARPRAAG